MRDTDDPQPKVIAAASSNSTVQTLSGWLQKAGWQTVTAVGAEEALAALRTQPADVIVTTMALDGMSGAQLVQAAFRMHPQLTALILVGAGEFQTARPATACGICELIGQDSAPEFMIEAVTRLMKRRETARNALWQNTQDILLRAIKAISTAIDAKTEHSMMHSRRVAELCVTAAQTMDLSDYETKTLEFAAYVHDLGKLGTPDEVLTKPGNLNDEEWVDVLKHPTFGSIIFAEIDELADVAAVMRHHHEKYNGTGYPDGLVGQAIPKLARILAVADAYEAMTSPRPYRPALSHQQAIYELSKNAGSQFDPWVVDQFIRALDAYEAETERAAA